MPSYRDSAVVRMDRTITEFESAYIPQATPYMKEKFHPKVKSACTENRTGRSGLKCTKALVIGDLGVGKSCLINRFVHNVFDREYRATIGVDFEVEKFSVLSVPISLQIWDTAGQERFKSIASSYYRGAQIVIVAFDLSSEDSLHHTVTWMNEACASADDPIKFIVGLKKDLLSETDYNYIEQKAICHAEQLKAEYWATSSKTGQHVKNFFFRAMCLSFDDLLLKELDSYNSTPKQSIGDIVRIESSQSDHENKKKSLPCCK